MQYFHSRVRQFLVNGKKNNAFKKPKIKREKNKINKFGVSLKTWTDRRLSGSNHGEFWFTSNKGRCLLRQMLMRTNHNPLMRESSWNMPFLWSYQLKMKMSCPSLLQRKPNLVFEHWQASRNKKKSWPLGASPCSCLSKEIDSYI